MESRELKESTIFEEEKELEVDLQRSIFDEQDNDRLKCEWRDYHFDSNLYLLRTLGKSMILNTKYGCESYFKKIKNRKIDICEVTSFSIKRFGPRNKHVNQILKKSKYLKIHSFTLNEPGETISPSLNSYFPDLYACWNNHISKIYIMKFDISKNMFQAIVSAPVSCNEMYFIKWNIESEGVKFPTTYNRRYDIKNLYLSDSGGEK